MSFTVIVELACLVASTVILLGGQQQRSYGWKLLCSLVGLAALTQCASMGIVVRFMTIFRFIAEVAQLIQLSGRALRQ